MKIFRFDPEAGKSIDQSNSSGFTLSRIANVVDEAVIHCAYLDANGVIGYHQAAASQLFLVAQGEGWVRDENSKKTPVKAGQAVYWDKGEWHESGTETGMTAVIIEGININPAKHMPLV